MANYATLKAAIQQVVKTNGNNEITGALLQQSLLAMVNSIGADYQFVGIATPSTTPGTPDQNVAYIAGPGTYPNFNNTVVPVDNIAVFKYNGSWAIETTTIGVSTDKLIKLTGMGAYGQEAGATQIGDVYYNTTAKQLRRITTSGGAFVVVPYYNGAIYTIGTDLYVWNGTDLVAVNQLINDTLQEFGNVLFGLQSSVANILKLELGSIRGSDGSNYNSTTRVRTNYIFGDFSLTVNNNWKILFLFKYAVDATGVISYVGYENMLSVKSINIQNGYINRVVIAKNDDSTISTSEFGSIVSSFKGALSFLEQNVDNTISRVQSFGERFGDFKKEILPNYAWEQGAILSTGGENTDPTRVKTATYFKGNGQTVDIFFATGYQARCFHYDSNKVYVDWTWDSEPFTLQLQSGHYYRFVVLKVNGDNISPSEMDSSVFSVTGLVLSVEDGTGIEGYARPLYQTEENPLSGKIVAFIGDSITQQSAATSQANTYHGVFAKKTGCTVRNLGVNGTCIANNTKNNLGSSRFVTRATAANLSDVSMVVVFGGTNDLSYDSKAIGPLFIENTITPSGNIGSKELAAPSDTDTFAGALHELITTIQQNVTPGTPIVFMTPLHRDHNAASNPNYKQCNENGDFMIDFVNAIKQICAFYAIPVLDMYSNSQLNPLSPDWVQIFGDGLHPNNTGHKIIGELLYRFVEQNIVIV